MIILSTIIIHQYYHHTSSLSFIIHHSFIIHSSFIHSFIHHSSFIIHHQFMNHHHTSSSYIIIHLKFRRNWKSGWNSLQHMYRKIQPTSKLIPLRDFLQSVSNEDVRRHKYRPPMWGARPNRPGGLTQWSREWTWTKRWSTVRLWNPL